MIITIIVVSLFWLGLAFQQSSAQETGAARAYSDPLHRPSQKQGIQQEMLQGSTSFHYTWRNRRDPFQPLHPEGSTLRRREDQEQPTPSVTVVGILIGPQHAHAMIRLPDGKQVIVREGSRLDPVRARIKMIMAQSIILESLSTPARRIYETRIRVVRPRSMQQSSR